MKKYKLGDLLFEFHAGKAIQTENIKNKGAYPVYGGNGQRGYTNSYNQNGEYLIIGRQGAYCGNVRYNIGKAYLTEHAIVGQAKENHNPIYIALKLSLMNLSQLQGQSAQPGLSVNTLSCISMEMPPKEIQDKIADIMLKLDRKIELNRQINDNLEAMAKQLYDYWFVQFDFPNEEGKPYKSSGGAMVWNEKLKREIPQEWSDCKIKDFINLFDSKRVPLSSKDRGERQGVYPYYGATGIMDYVNDYIFDGDYILLAEDGSTSDAKGFPIVQYIWGKNWVNNHAHIILPKNERYTMFTYQMLRSIPAKQIETGSIQKKISQENLCGYKMVLPNSNLLEKYENVVSPLWEKRKRCIEEINILTKQRDELLPLLMNGQATVNYHLSAFICSTIPLQIHFFIII